MLLFEGHHSFAHCAEHTEVVIAAEHAPQRAATAGGTGGVAIEHRLNPLDIMFNIARAPAGDQGAGRAGLGTRGL
jgi:hypothetical protein